MGVYVKLAGTWTQIGTDSNEGGAGWAQITGGDVSTFTDDQGAEWEIHKFTSASDMQVLSPGLVRTFIVGGGAGGSRNFPDAANGRGGNGGGTSEATLYLETGAYSAVIGAGGTEQGGAGGATSFCGISATGAVNKGGSGAGNGASGAVGGDGPSDPGGAGVEFLGSFYGGGGGAGGYGGGATAPPGVGGVGGGGDGAVLGSGLEPPNTTNSGVYPAMNGDANTGGGGGASGTWFSPGQSDWGRGGAGGTGVAIAAVQTSPPVDSGIVASGGTESTYVGDGTNGVLGQTYKVHTFTASGALTVTQGGEAEILVCGGGGPSGNSDGSGYASGGGGGGVWEGIVNLGAQTYTVTVGGAGGRSRFGDSTMWTGNPGQGGGSGRPSNGGDSGNGYTGGNAGGQGTACTGASSAGNGNIDDPPPDGWKSYITGSLVEYGRGGRDSSSSTITPNTGQGGDVGGASQSSRAGASGIVVVRYLIATP
jgi:hypothetical protein